MFIHLYKHVYANAMQMHKQKNTYLYALKTVFLYSTFLKLFKNTYNLVN